MASIKVKFRPPSHEGEEGRIFFQAIHNRIARQWTTDYRIFCEEWDSKKSAVVLASEKGRQEYLASIRQRVKWDLERFKRIIAEFSAKKDSFATDEILDEFVKQHSQQSFFVFMESVIARLKELGKRRTSETYMSAFNSFKRYACNMDLCLDGFNSELMESYQAYLMRKGLIPNSTSFHMRILRAVYNRAVEKGLVEDQRPFRHVYTGIDKTTKRAIDIGTIKKLKEADFGKNPKAAYARDIFLLSFYMRGMSFVDMAFLKKSDLANGQISYRRRKTGQLLKIKWTADMQKVLDNYPMNTGDYLLPIITSSMSSPYNQYRAKQYQVNKWLKAVAKKICLKAPLTLYCSRHSWASVAKANGVPVGVISDGLGHDSEVTTQIYLSTLDTSAVDKANEMIMRLL